MLKKTVLLFVCLVLMLFLLTDPVRAVKASADGLLLWSESLVPVLLPFFILSDLMIALDGVSSVTRFLYAPLRKIFGCSAEGCFCLAVGFLCGFPVGAKVTADLVRERHISLEEGTYLLSFCNNVSPAFLTGYCITQALEQPSLVGVSLLLVFGVPALLGIVTRKGRSFQEIPAEKKTSGSQISFKIVDACIMNGLESILKLGGYIILFSMLAKLLMRIPCPFPTLVCAAVGIMEITNGIAFASSVPALAPRILWALILGIASFGGLSGLAQTQSMIQNSGLSLFAYFKAKLVSAVLVTGLALLLGLCIIPPGP